MAPRLAILAGLLCGIVVAALVLGGLYAVTPNAAVPIPTVEPSPSPVASAPPSASPSASASAPPSASPSASASALAAAATLSHIGPLPVHFWTP